MHALVDTDLLLQLLREAGDEAVTLDELQIVGVTEPGQALLALELAGHAVARVYERPENGRPVTAFRLDGTARPSATPAAPAGPVAPTTSAAVARSRSADTRLVLGALLGAVLLLLLAGARRRR